MYRPISLFIVFRYLWNPHIPIFKKIITFLSITGIIISIASLIIIISVMNGFQENFRKNILSFIPHLMITNNEKCVNKIDFPKDILKIKNIDKISDNISKEGIIKSKNNITMAEIVGINSSNYENIKNYNIKNILDIFKIQKNNAIIGKSLAKKLNVHIGDSIKLTVISDKKNFFSNNNLNKNKFTIASIFSTEHEVDYYQILINKKDALNLLNYPKDCITGWRVWLKNPFFLNINQIKNLSNGLSVLDWKTQKGELFKAMQIEKYIMLFFLFLILLVAIFNVVIILTIHIIEKKNTIAILKTLGLVDWKIMIIFVILGSVIAIIGNILGTVISIILIMQENFLKSFIGIFFDNINFSIIIIPSQIIYINIISTLLTFFSILYPSWMASKIKPTKILSNE